MLRTLWFYWVKALGLALLMFACFSAYLGVQAPRGVGDMILFLLLMVCLPGGLGFLLILWVDGKLPPPEAHPSKAKAVASLLALGIGVLALRTIYHWTGLGGTVRVIGAIWVCAGIYHLRVLHPWSTLAANLPLDTRRRVQRFIEIVVFGVFRVMLDIVVNVILLGLTGGKSGFVHIGGGGSSGGGGASGKW